MSHKERVLTIPDSLGEDGVTHRPKGRVELHVHLDGAIRCETIWEVLKAKGLPIPGSGSLTDLRRALMVRKPSDLAHFLTGFGIFAPIYSGDLKMMKRIALEFCEDEAREGVAYVEARFSPHLMECTKVPEVKVHHIVQAIVEGFKEGEVKFGVKARLILCCIRGMSDNTMETLQLCERFRLEGVVGLDIAGNEATVAEWGSDAKEIAAFTEAKRLGIHRTVHAGEAGPAKLVTEALDVLHAERIGHGYRSLDDPNVYGRCLKERVHFECCPHSSILTGAVSLTEIVKHPIVQFATDNANFSISTDDPTITNSHLSDEYAMVQSWGLTEAHLARANFNAARCSFLPPDEKKTLIRDLKIAYGIDLD